jgi:hypothetical protein
MRNLAIVFFGTIVLGGTFATVSNAQDLASDQAYCRKLVNEWRLHGTHGGGDESLDLAVAIDQCRSGNPEPAIPVLEKRMLDAGFDIPPRQ